MTHIRYPFALCVLVAVLAPVLARAADPLKVVATTADLGAVARAVGGDAVVVTTLARPTEDAHFVDAKPSFIVKLNRADLYVKRGLDLEVGWAPVLEKGARNRSEERRVGKECRL